MVASVVRVVVFRLAAIAAAPLVAAAVLAAPAIPAAAQDIDVNTAAALALKERMTPVTLEQAFPGAEALELVNGRPPALAVMIGGEVAGHLFSTKDTVNATGYSGVAFDLVAGLRLDGSLTGAALLWHREAIVGRGVPEERLDDFVAGFGATTLKSFRAVSPDLLKRATVSGRAMKAGVRSAARVVHAAHVTGTLNNPVDEPTLDRVGFVPLTTEQLWAAGSITGTQVSIREIIKIFEKAGGDGARGGDVLTLDFQAAQFGAYLPQPFGCLPTSPQHSYPRRRSVRTSTATAATSLCSSARGKTASSYSWDRAANSRSHLTRTSRWKTITCSRASRSFRAARSSASPATIIAASPPVWGSRTRTP